MVLESPSVNLDCRNRGGTEPKKKRLGSMKFSKTQSSDPSARGVKTRSGNSRIDSFNDDASSEPSQIQSPHASPTPRRNTSCSDAASTHNSEDGSNSNSTGKRPDSWKPSIVSFRHLKPVGNTTRVVTLKSSRPLKKKNSRIAPFPNFADYVMPHRKGDESDGASVSSTSSTDNTEKKGGAGIRKTLKKSRSSLRLASRRAKSKSDFPLRNSSHGAKLALLTVAAGASPNYLKETSCSEGKKMLHTQASLHDSESSFGSIDASSRDPIKSKSNSASSSMKSTKTLRRTSTLKPLRILVNKSSFKSKRSAVNNNRRSQDSQEVSSCIRATCSSILKISKFPHHVELHPESEIIPATKVCAYHYCSLHGHHDSPAPPLKRLLSKKRRLLKTQKSMKQRSLSSLRIKKHNDLITEIETSQMVMTDEPELPYETNGAGMAISLAEGEDVSELLISETSHPGKGVQENLDQEFQSPSMEFTKLANADRTESSCESSDIMTRSSPADSREATEDNSVVPSTSCAHSLEEVGAAGDENVNFTSDHVTVGQFAAVGDSEPNFTARETCKSQLHKKKHVSMWHTIHQHMVSGLAAGTGTQSVKGAGEGKQVDDINRWVGPQSSGCSSGFSDSCQNVAIENDERDDQEIELRKMYAIKMVREAVEKILLPEIQDQSFDDQSISGDTNPEPELLLENSDAEGGKLSIQNSLDKTTGTEMEVITSKDGNGAEKKTPKGWSNLKKLILLKRFIKELEKVRLFNPRKPQHLPGEPDQEAKKVSLRRQFIDRKKSSEEWMLDYAIQQAISELAPTQKRKVALLIKAFETVAPPSDEQQIQETLPISKGIRHQGYCTESELDNYVSEGTSRDKKIEGIVTSNLHDWAKSSITTNKQPTVHGDEKADQEVHQGRILNSYLDLLKEDSASRGQTVEVEGLSDVTSQPSHTIKSQIPDSKGKPEINDKAPSSTSDNDPLKQVTVVGEVKFGDSDSWEQLTTMYNQNSSPTEFCTEDEPESNSDKLEIGNLTSATDGQARITKTLSAHNLAGTAAHDTLTSAACFDDPSEEFTAAMEQENGDSDIETESAAGFGPTRYSEPDNRSQEAYKPQFDNEKHVNMWHLIHQHMVAGLAAEPKTKQLKEENEEHWGDASSLVATKNEAYLADARNINHDTESQEVELHKNYAIKLVREAIEKILLPEVQDLSSGDQSVTSETLSEQDLIDTNSGEGGEPSITTSTDSVDYEDRFMGNNSNKVRNDISPSREGARLATTSIIESEDEETASKVHNKANKQTPRGWSNLKKMTLLNRFVKELDKVRKFKPKKPRHLPSEPGSGAEQVCLWHQTMDERRSTEEWMLDYALQKVVSELAPRQRRKVELLVKAFETVAPPSAELKVQVTSPEFKGTNPERCCSVREQKKFSAKVAEADINLKNIVPSNLDNVDNINSGKPDVDMGEEAQKEVHRDRALSLEILQDGSDSCGKGKLYGLSGENVEPSYVSKCAAPEGSRESTATNNIASSAADCDLLEKLTTAKEKKSSVVEPEFAAKAAYKTQLDKQKYITMWHLLCQYVVSDVATKFKTQLLDEQYEDDSVNGATTLYQIAGPCHGYSRTDHESNGEKVGFSQRDAVKLVQEAIEEILHPESQDDSSDTQSTASDIILEQELFEKDPAAHANVAEPNIITSTDSPTDSFQGYANLEVNGHRKIDEEEKGSAVQNTPTPDGHGVISIPGNKSDQHKPRNWNKLKKIILLKRSIKALEKARKSQRRTPQYLPLLPDTEEEKVDLKHRSKDERRKAEEWMLDYALQHIVTKLNPARKRRVSMLVEAFEAVVPLPEI